MYNGNFYIYYPSYQSHEILSIILSHRMFGIQTYICLINAKKVWNASLSFLLLGLNYNKQTLQAIKI